MIQKVTGRTRLGRNNAWVTVADAAEMGRFTVDEMCDSVEKMVKSRVLKWVRDEDRVVASYNRWYK